MERVRLVAFAAALAVGAVTVPARGACGPDAGPDPVTIQVLGHGWHTGIALRTGDVPPGLWPEAADFPQAAWLEVGWGDRDFYQAREPTLSMALRASFGSASVLHVVGVEGPIERFFTGAEVVEVALSRRGVEALVRFVAGSVARGSATRAAPLGPGRYGRSAFYAATGRYSLLNTCNTWVGEALHAAGCPVTPAWATTAEGLLSQARRLRGPR